jgi:hypothetical protein
VLNVEDEVKEVKMEENKAIRDSCSGVVLALFRLTHYFPSCRD